MKPTGTLLLCLLTLAVLAGCGLKGPLYLPDQSPPATTADDSADEDDTDGT